MTPSVCAMVANRITFKPYQNQGDKIQVWDKRLRTYESFGGKQCYNCNIRVYATYSGVYAMYFPINIMTFVQTGSPEPLSGDDIEIVE